MDSFIIKLHVYPFEVMVSIGQKKTEINKGLKKYRLKVNREGNYTVIFDTGQILISLADLPTKPRQYAIMQHEIFHAAFFLMDKIGIPLNKTNDEAYAYLIGYLTQEIYSKIFSWEE